MKKILIVITTSFVEFGGLTTVALNYYRFMDKTGLSIDFASTNEPDTVLIDELHREGSRYYYLGRRSNIIVYRKKLKRLIEKNHYDILHVHGNSATMSLELMPAKKLGVPVRIAHLHTSQSSYPWLNKLLLPLFKNQFTNAVAVSETAGNWLFGKGNYVVLNNAIDLEKYRFQYSVRTKIRNELGIEEKFVIGTVGKLNSGKNQSFLLEVFAEITKIRNDAFLIIVGGGPLETELKKRAKSLGIADRVLFTGMRTDANCLIQAFDYFVFPSVYEGLGLVLIESQASGLPCLASDAVPKEAKVSKLLTYLSLSAPKGQWVRKVLQDVKVQERQQRADAACNEIRVHGYDIRKEAQQLRDIYLN